MSKRPREIWRAHPWLVTGIALALALTVFFAARMALFAVYWSDPAHRDQALRGWMTPGYVARSWHVPHHELQEALGDLARPGTRRTLQQIADDSGLPLSEVIARTEAVIAAHRAGR